MRDVLIAGGGIAGLAAAVALARTGSRIVLRERATDLRAFGAGLQVSRNGMAVLDGLGLGSAVRGQSIGCTAVVAMDAVNGRRIARFAIPDPDNWRFIHRGDLVTCLVAVAQAAGVIIQTGQAVAPSDLADWPGLAVAADGLHSQTRVALNPGQAPFFTGQVAYRAVIAGDHPPEARIWMGAGFHVVTYPLPGDRVNIVAVHEQAAWTAADWAQVTTRAALIAAFPGLCPALADLFGRVVSVQRWGLHRTPVADCWVKGKLVLLGDAAHPTLPFLAQGANLALEDAWVLAARLVRDGDMATALAQFAALRRPRVSRAIAAAAANARKYHLQGPARWVAHRGLRAIGATAPGLFLRRYDWLYHHDVTRLFPLDASAPPP